MRFRGVLVSLLFMVTIWSPGAAFAFNQRITVYAVVPETRAIYVNDAGYITRIAGNTIKNIDPKVYDIHNQEISMTDTIKAQYDQFLKSHNGHLEASKVYELNPVSVNTTPNIQTVQVQASPSQLALSI